MSVSVVWSARKLEVFPAKGNCQKLWGIYTEIDERARPGLEPLPQLSRGIARKISIGRGPRLEPHPTDSGPPYRRIGGCDGVRAVYPVPTRSLPDRGGPGTNSLCGEP